MVEVKMIDTMGFGISRMTRAQRSRFLPLPDYHRSTAANVVLEVLGRPIDERYTQMLLDRQDLDIDTVILLDRIQKKLPVTNEAIAKLKRDGLVEGRKPNWHVAASIATSTKTETNYTLTKGMDDARLKELIKSHLKKFPGAARPDIDSLVTQLLSSALNDKQKKDKVTNILAAMKNRDCSIQVDGRGPGARWYLSEGGR